MFRTLEPELMDDPHAAAAYAAADFSAPDAAFVEALEAWHGPARGRVVDLGCGPGNIAVRLADRGAEVVGVDGADAMIQLAPRGPRLRYVVARVPLLTIDGAPFDLVVSNSLLHHLPDPMALWRTVVALGRPGAAVFVGDLRRPASAEDAAALVERYAADAPDVLRRDFLASLHAAFEVEEVRAQLAAAGLALAVEAVGDRHLRVWGRLPAR